MKRKLIKKKIMLKIAHPGLEHTNRIKREVKFYRILQVKKQIIAVYPGLSLRIATNQVPKAMARPCLKEIYSTSSCLNTLKANH